MGQRWIAGSRSLSARFLMLPATARPLLHRQIWPGVRRRSSRADPLLRHPVPRPYLTALALGYPSPRTDELVIGHSEVQTLLTYGTLLAELPSDPSRF